MSTQLNVIKASDTRFLGISWEEAEREMGEMDIRKGEDVGQFSGREGADNTIGGEGICAALGFDLRGTTQVSVDTESLLANEGSRQAQRSSSSTEHHRLVSRTLSE